MDADSLKKARGAFFTPPVIARYLVDWAIRSPDDIVLEPSCGEAVFLLSAAERLKGLGIKSDRWKSQLHGVEIFQDSARCAESLLQAHGFSAHISVADFFEHAPSTVYNVVIGNPPFVRYQNFSGAARARSLEAALKQGVRLSGLASSWAAFVVKAALHLAPEGRLALVLPAELLSVNYAQEVRRFLLERFARVRLIMFEERVFPGVLEEVVLLLAEGSGKAPFLEVYQTRDVSSLQSVEAAPWTSHLPRNDKWTPALLAQNTFATFQALANERFERLKDWGRTYLGAVTGNNKYFSLTLSQAARLGFGNDDVIRISPPGSRHLRGLAFTEAVWQQLAKEGSRCLLFYPSDEPSHAARKYIESGDVSGVASAYKCRVRRPWWRVPLVQTPDLFLTYMNHDRPRLVSNAARSQILNSVYGVSLGHGRQRLGQDILPIACLNSITLLGAEIVGRAYGGGLLKMEPREADRLPVPSLDLVESVEPALRNVKPQLAKALRAGRLSDAAKIVDQIVLADVPKSDLNELRLARELLFQRRRTRGKSVEN